MYTKNAFDDKDNDRQINDDAHATKFTKHCKAPTSI